MSPRPEPLRLGVLASGRGSNLQSIIDAIEAGRLPARLAVVVSDREQAPALGRASRHGAPALYVSPKDHGDRAAYDRALYQALDAHGVEPRDPDVVEEVEGRGAVDQEIVHAHGHEVDPDRVVPVGEEGDLQLAADAVGGGDEDRLREPLGDADEAGEGADPADHLRAHRPPGEHRDAARGLVAGVDVHAGVPIRQGIHRVYAPNSGSCAVSSAAMPTR